jgi:Xaa-Pro dipeptidase
MSNRLRAGGLALLPLDEVELDLGRLKRLRRAIVSADCAAAVFVDPANIRYATGTSNMQVYAGHNPCRYVFVPAEGPVVLFEFSNCAHLATGRGAVDEVRPAVSWYHFVAGPRVAEKADLWAAELAELTLRHGGGNRRLAIDRVDPMGTWALQRHGIDIQDGQAVASHAKKIKTPEEIKAVRNAVAVCDEGLRRMRAALEPGITEQRLWSYLHQANAELGGEWIETRLLTSGPKTYPWYQECGERVIEAGDIISLDTDLVGAHGYSADLSRSWVAGEGAPKEHQRRLYALAHEVLYANIALFRPGITFREIAELARQAPEPYSDTPLPALAHGIGLVNEYPLLLSRRYWDEAGYDDVVEEGMVLCVESYLADKQAGEGVKLEQQILVGATGPEILSTYPMDEALL